MMAQSSQVRIAGPCTVQLTVTFGPARLARLPGTATVPALIASPIPGGTMSETVTSQHRQSSAPEAADIPASARPAAGAGTLPESEHMSTWWT